MKQQLEEQLSQTVEHLYGVKAEIELTRTDEQFGDYSTNIALQLAKQVAKPPREIAEAISAELNLETVVAGAGFINLKLDTKALFELCLKSPAKPLEGQSVVAEYSDPNPFKVLHAGHLYTSLVGDAVARLMESAGAHVHRVNFGGDVGLHVGKAMWAIINKLGGKDPTKLSEVAADNRLDWIGKCYVEGNTAFENDESAKEQIIATNKRVYELHAQNDHDSPFAQIYWTTRQWSYDGFAAFYERLGMTPFEKYYPESDVAGLGLETVRKHIGPVYQESEGAVIFRGEEHGLFTQVFISSAGLPTYAAKDVGLIFQKQRDFAPDKSFIFTDVAQKDHLAVVMQSISQFEPRLAAATVNYTHGQVKMAGGVKMSSRSGNFLSADDILNAAQTASQALNKQDNNDSVLGAVKYAFLKNRIGGDIVYDPKESVSLEGNSGPYLQYAHARARSIIAKASSTAEVDFASQSLQPAERSLVRKIGEYAEVVDKAVAELLPHHICSYLYELAQVFNRFYENSRVIGDERQNLRLKLVGLYADKLKAGLELLGIAALDKM